MTIFEDLQGLTELDAPFQGRSRDEWRARP